MATRKPRFRPGAGGALTPVNNAARRAVATQAAANAGQVTSRRSIANGARRKSAGGTGG